MSEREPIEGQWEEPLLPKVKPEIGKAVAEEYEQEGREKFMAKLLDRVGKQNPAIFHIAYEMAQKSKDPKAVLETSLMIYRVLESQIQADKMNEEFGK